MSSPVAHSLIGLALGLIRFLPRYPNSTRPEGRDLLRVSLEQGAPAPRRNFGRIILRPKRIFHGQSLNVKYPGYRQWGELRSQLRALWRPLLFCVLLANLPDLDYFFGIFRSNGNYYHQTVTHTLVWIGMTALAIWAYGRLRERRTACWSFGLLLALLGSHLLSDWLTVDYSPPIGLMLAWPFSNRLYHAAFAFFPPPAKQTWTALWSLQNLRLVLVETAITLPLVIIVLWLKRRRSER